MFAQLAGQTDESGQYLSDQDLVDHMLGLPFGAHDTTTSALTTMCIKLAENPAWQVGHAAGYTNLIRSQAGVGYQRTHYEGIRIP